MIIRFAKKLLNKIKHHNDVEHPLIRILNKNYGHLLSVTKGEAVNALGHEIPWFTYPAIDYLEQLDFGDKHLFEWGSGNSSKYFARKVKSIISIEISKEWYEKVDGTIKSNQEVFLKDEKEYANCISSFRKKFDIIIIDGIHRDECAKIAPEYLAVGGMIIFDNSDRHASVCLNLRNRGFSQIDFHGFGPINFYTWTTSILFQQLYFKSLKEQPVIPKGGGY